MKHFQELNLQGHKIGVSLPVNVDPIISGFPKNNNPLFIARLLEVNDASLLYINPDMREEPIITDDDFDDYCLAKRIFNQVTRITLSAMPTLCLEDCDTEDIVLKRERFINVHRLGSIDQRKELANIYADHNRKLDDIFQKAGTFFYNSLTKHIIWYTPLWELTKEQNSPLTQELVDNIDNMYPTFSYGKHFQLFIDKIEF